MNVKPWKCTTVIKLFHIAISLSKLIEGSSGSIPHGQALPDFSLPLDWTHSLSWNPDDIFSISSEGRIVVNRYSDICEPLNTCILSQKNSFDHRSYSNLHLRIRSAQCNGNAEIQLKGLLIGKSHSFYSGACLSRNTVITNLTDHLQHFVNCKLSFRTSDPRFVVDSEGLLRTQLDICDLQQLITAKGMVQISCRNSSSTLDFNFHFHSHKVPPFIECPEIGERPSVALSRRKRNVNPTTPYFSRPFYNEHVREEQPPGTIVDTITADDGDPGLAGQIRYSLLANRDGRSQSMFTIDPVSGRISTTQKLDREYIRVHHFTLKAADQGNPSLTGQVPLTIYVDDTNDHPPKFESPSYSERIFEDVPIGTTVSTVRATDSDAGENAAITYSIINPEPPNDAFSVHPTEGSISTRKILDRETTDRYKLLIRATDGAVLTERKSATTTVLIVLLDRNDNYPKFTKNKYSVKVREDLNSATRPVIETIQAYDLDDGENGALRYSISGGNSGETFGINEQTGKLFLQKQLDYESVNSYQLRVRVQDNGSPSNTNSTTVFIEVLDTNDNAPKFYTTNFRETVSESVKVGFSIIQVQAFDFDSGKNAELVYSLDSAPENMPIKVDSNSGWISTIDELDRETAAEYKFNVKAQDLGEPPKSAFASIVVTIIDENDNSPVFDPRYYEHAISEEISRGSPVLSVTARDKDSPENARITYAISGGNTNNAFSIMSQMGEGLISVARQLQYKEQNRYVLAVTATDSGGLTDTAEVVINITDANTHRPRFVGSPPYRIKVSEDVDVGHKVFTVSATDEDVGENARLIFTMTGSDMFQIDPNTGVISTREELDREKTSGYTISVTATDHGKPPLTETTEVEITVEDSNDNEPSFEKPVYKGRISENALIGTSVVQITATDPDFGDNGNVRYTFKGGHDGDGDFTIDSTLGIIRTAHNLDRELTSSYKLRAFAIDNGTPRKSTSVLIDVEVEDANDNAPQFDKPNIDLYIKENSPVGSTVGKIVANDPDVGVNAQVEYSIVGGPDAQFFLVIPSPDGGAIVKTKTELDYESGKISYQFTLRAMSTPLFLDAKVTIHVQDQNDNSPSMHNFKIILNNYDNKFPIGTIGKVPASDPDVSDKLKYRFISGNEGNVLHLDRDTGDIRLDSRLMSDVPRNGTLRVEVTDGVNSVQANCDLSVKMVTTSMLFNSITVRLNNMTSTAFLSPLYELFVDALAAVFGTEKANIFIFNVHDDTDVISKVLNVSFSVRSSVKDGQDVFIKPQDLRERVYLWRETLAKISTMEVMPFDDNLCVQEPCLNHEECQSILKFGNASDFLVSTTMLFRPIRPVNSYHCSCPKGFSGMEASYLCDTEVNLCYSSPCKNNGTCVQAEGAYSCQCRQGFAGPVCEYDLSRRFEDGTCPDSLCGALSRCVPLIRGGFRCEGCPSHDYYNQYCEMTTRGFSKGSFLVFPALRKRHRFTIEMEFATREKDGLLFYNGRFNERHDFISLEVSSGQVRFSFSLGSEVMRLVTNLSEPVHNGEWQRVTVHYVNRNVVLAVGSDCDVDLALKHPFLYGSRCAVTASKTLPKRCASITESCHRYLDLTGPLQLGGLPAQSMAKFPVDNKFYTGCMRNVKLDRDLLDLGTFVYNNGTVAGCNEKRNFCSGGPCRNGGTCVNGWKTYRCECPVQFGGHDCSKRLELSRYYSGSSFVRYQSSLPVIQLPWYNSLAFRTTREEGVLLTVRLGNQSPIVLAMARGLLQYRHPRKTVMLDDVRLNDGLWHHVEVQWLFSAFKIVVDHGQIERSFEMGNWVATQSVSQVYVGAEVVSGATIINGFTGCIKDVAVGNRQDSYLGSPSLVHNTIRGCVRPDPCVLKPCRGNHSVCEARFDQHTCTCEKGYIGRLCLPVCEAANPCQHGAACRQDPGTNLGYRCECTKFHTGLYCETTVGHPCPATWWGHPICGPCDCDQKKGFNPSCDKKTGACSCLANYYRPPGSDRCHACSCDPVGSVTGQQCDPVTGQCPCKSGVTGQRCEQCGSRYAQITARGCEAVFEACPRQLAAGIWWNTTKYETVVHEPCPRGALGQATRYCSRDRLWLQPDTFSCTSVNFVLLNDSLHRIDEGSQNLDARVIMNLMSQLEKATRQTTRLYGNDVNITYRITSTVLEYENRQSGLNLTHTRDRNFIKNLLWSLDRVFDSSYHSLWSEISKPTSSEEGGASSNQVGVAHQGGVSKLLKQMETYVTKLAENMESTLIPPFDVVAGDIFLGIDKIAKDLANATLIPKYNNKVQNPLMYDKSSRVRLPKAVYEGTGIKDFSISKSETRDAYVGYVFYGKLGEVLPQAYNESITSIPGIPLSVSTSAITLRLVTDNKLVSGPLTEPISINFRQLVDSNRTRPQCAYWRYTDDSGMSGEWSTAGCTLVGQYLKSEHRYVTCECQHMTTFAAIMDMSEVEHMYAVPVVMQVITYVGLSLACLILLVGMILLLFLRRLDSNINSIHVNIMLAVFVWMIFYMLGVNATQPEIVCRIVTICLHFFFLCSFAWLFVECLHLYRMMTEVRNVNTGTMKFYYVIGYVIPGIIVGLAVGLDTDGYGNRRFCMLSIYSALIWSFIGPVVILLVMNVVAFVLAARATFSVKSDEDRHLYRMNLLAVLIVLPLLLLAWIFALLAVNTDDPRTEADIHLAFHYLVATVCLLLALFLLLGHVILNPRTRYELKRCWAICRGDKDAELDESDQSGARNNTLSRSALAYHQETADPMSRFNMAISTTSTTSRSTSKTSSGGYGPQTGRSVTTSSGPSDYQNPAYVGYDSSYFHDKSARTDDPDTGEHRHGHRSRKKKPRRDSDSDSDLSMGRASIELASSHSSDDDEDDLNWADVTVPKNKALERVKAQSKPATGNKQQQPIPPSLPTVPVTAPAHPRVPPRTDSIANTSTMATSTDGNYNDAYSHSTNSDTEPKREAVRVMEKPRPAPRQSLGPAPGGPPVGPAPKPGEALKGSMEMLTDSIRELDTTVSSIRSRDMPVMGPPPFPAGGKRPPLAPPSYEMATRDSRASTPGSGPRSPRGLSPHEGPRNRSFSPSRDSPRDPLDSSHNRSKELKDLMSYGYPSQGGYPSSHHAYPGSQLGGYPGVPPSHAGYPGRADTIVDDETRV